MPSEFIQRQIDRLLNEAETALGRLDWDAVRDRPLAQLAPQAAPLRSDPIFLLFPPTRR